MILASILIFTNLNGNYHIRDLDDNILWVCYKTCPKGWMDQILYIYDLSSLGHSNPMFMAVLRWFGWLIAQVII